VRVAGRVAARGHGLASVAVSDGVAVTTTRADGSYELWSNTARGHVFVTTPRGHDFPRRPFRPLRRARGGNLRADFDLEPLPCDDTGHAFLAVADPQAGTKAQMGRFAGETVADMRRVAAGIGAPVFAVALGDLVDDATELWDDYARAVRGAGVPVLPVVGNHDVDLRGTPAFRRRFGPTHYSFERGEIHYVVLDNVAWRFGTYHGRVGRAQRAWLRRDLARVEPGRTVVVFAHIPLHGSYDARQGGGGPVAQHATADREELADILAPFDAHFVAGHMHEHEHGRWCGVREHVVAAACGAWWAEDFNLDGTPNGYTVFEANGSSLRWRHRGVADDGDASCRLTRDGDTLVANVWDWEPGDRVLLYEDGVCRGAMRRFTDVAPVWRRARSRACGDAAPRTAHLFRARVHPGARIVVEYHGAGRREPAAVAL